MMDPSPTIVVIGGPNGAGKSTAAPGLLGHLGVETFVNADLIAQGLSGLNPQTRAFEAGRVMLSEMRRLVARNETFAFESTLASRSFAPWIKRLQSCGYEFWLEHVWVPTPEIALARVASRVRAGGHSVPEDVVRRRWRRSAVNFWHLYAPIAQRWVVYDNSNAGAYERVAQGGLAYRETEVANSNDWDLLRDLQ